MIKYVIWLLFLCLRVGRGGVSPCGTGATTRTGAVIAGFLLADDKRSIEQLAARYSFIDGSKVGMFGHSGG